MSEKTYISTTVGRAPLPRSKRLREAGLGGGSTSSTVVFSGAQGATTVVSGNTHNHSNLSTLEQIGTDNGGYLWLTQIREMLENEETVSRRVRDKVKAGYADVAHDLDEDSPVNDRFLSRSQDDTAQGKIDFLQGLKSQQLAKLLGGAEFGQFFSDLYGGYGGAVDAQGNAEFESLRVRSVMEVMELVVNRLTAIEGDQLLTESDTIESVTDLGDGRYRLKLQSKYTGYFTAMTENAVIKGMVNNIYDAALSGVGLKYYTSWMRINAVMTATNTIEVTLYPGDECPGGQNFPPCELMRIARWGHQTDETRQTCIVLSTTERRIIFYQHVTKPIIDDTNIGMCLGKAPEFLKATNQIDDQENSLYVKAVFAEGVYHVDVKGEPICEHVIVGPWEDPLVTGFHYRYKTFNEDTKRYEIHEVYHKGCQWQCMVDGTTEEPSFRSTAWAMTMGNSDFRIEFEEPQQVYRLRDFQATLTIRAYVGWMDITEDLPPENIEWTRYTEGADGVQRVASDNIWAVLHGASGKQLHLTSSDLDIDSAGVPKKFIITATAHLTDDITAVAEFSSI